MKGLSSLALSVILSTVVLGTLSFMVVTIYTGGITDLGNTGDDTEEVRCDYQREEVLDPDNNIGSDDLIGCEVEEEIEAQAERIEIQANAIETLNENATCGNAYSQGELLTENITCGYKDGELVRMLCTSNSDESENIRGVAVDSGAKTSEYTCINDQDVGYGIWQDNPDQGPVEIR